MMYSTPIGSTDYLVETLGPQHSRMELIPDDYGMHALRVDLSNDWKVAGERICRHDFLENFSILLKFRATPQTSSFTMLNITRDSGIEFSIVVDLRKSVVTVEFGDYCEVREAQLPFHSPIDFGDNQWHRLALAFGPGHITLYQDCEKNTTIAFRRPQTCRVTCDETVTISVLEEIDGPGTVSIRILTVYHFLEIYTNTLSMCPLL